MLRLHSDDKPRMEGCGREKTAKKTDPDAPESAARARARDSEDVEARGVCPGVRKASLGAKEGHVAT